MKITTGIDVIEVERIKKNIEDYGDRFLNRVFTEKEVEYCESKNSQKYQSYAARFAAKEAIFKAVSAVLSNRFSIEWKDIEIINDETGRPRAFLSSRINGMIDWNYDIDISISHISEIAMASCVMKFEGNM